MNINLRTILIVFLVSLLGASIGTFGVIELSEDTNISSNNNNITETISTVTYPEIEKGDYAQAIEKAYDTVVEIQSTVITQSFFGTSQSYSLGSGVIVTTDGYIVTNNHVVEDASEVIVKRNDGVEYEATIIGTDAKTDLAVLKIEATGLQACSIADSGELVLGQETIVIGNPLGEGITCSNGIVSALEKEITVNNYTMTVIQTNAAVNEGNSGGGLFNMNGDLIGIVNAKSSSSSYYSSATIEGMGYAIPSNTVKTIIKDLIDYGYVKARPYLGVTIYSYQTYSNGFYQGLMVSGVIDGSGADIAGIKKGDIICKIDGNQITSYSSYSKLIDNYQIGDIVTLTILRNNQLMEIRVTLQETKQ